MYKGLSTCNSNYLTTITKDLPEDKLLSFIKENTENSNTFKSVPLVYKNQILFKIPSGRDKKTS
jgi:hypothetical protein